jgi:hypothetical protein
MTVLLQQIDATQRETFDLLVTLVASHAALPGKMTPSHSALVGDLRAARPPAVTAIMAITFAASTTAYAVVGRRIRKLRTAVGDRSYDHGARMCLDAVRLSHEESEGARRGRPPRAKSQIRLVSCQMVRSTPAGARPQRR